MLTFQCQCCNVPVFRRLAHLFLKVKMLPCLPSNASAATAWLPFFKSKNVKCAPIPCLPSNVSSNASVTMSVRRRLAYLFLKVKMLRMLRDNLLPFLLSFLTPPPPTYLSYWLTHSSTYLLTYFDVKGTMCSLIMSCLPFFLPSLVSIWSSNVMVAYLFLCQTLRM